MTVHYSCPVNRKLELWVNGEKTELRALNSGGEQEVGTACVKVKLLPGDNVIRMGNSFGWAPDIDMFTLKKI